MSNNVVHFTDGNFEQEVLKSDIPVLVDFWAPWCGPCRQISPLIDKLADSHAGRVKVGKVNVDDSPDVAMRYGVRSIPMLLIFSDGQVAAQQVGALPMAGLEKMLEGVLE